MAETSYLCLGGVELTNACRTIAYMRNGLKPHTTSVQDCCCADLDKILEDEPYRLPHLDGAPWFDPTDPDSQEFGGLLVTSIEGLDFATTQRSVTSRIGDGATIGRRRLGPRVIKVTGLLTGSSCCGIAYGRRWLSAALSGSLACAPGRGCGGDDLEYLDCCPEICEDAPGFVSYPDCASGSFRTLRDVALTDGPTPTGVIGGNCACCDDVCGMVQVEFTLTAGRPHALRAPMNIADCVTWGPAPPPDDECIIWSKEDDCVNDLDGCAKVTTVPCNEDPNCPLTVPPTLPVPQSLCACSPAVRRRVCMEIGQATIPDWADAVPVVKIFSGDTALRGVRVRFYPNPLNRPIEQLDACAFCSEINISYIGPSSTFTLDSTRRRAVVVCPGQDELPAGGVLSGSEGLPFTWPVLDCTTPYLVCVEAASDTIADNACVSLDVVVRDL